MRYRKGYIALSDDRDLPFLVTIRNARAITYDQICKIACIDGQEKTRRSVYWRLSRLERNGFVRRMIYDQFFSQPIFSITRMGLEFLEQRGQTSVALPSTVKEIVRKTQILHSVELASIRAALAADGILQSWRWELEIVSNNLVYGDGDAKDFDAIAEIAVGNQTKSVAIEFERTLKGSARYEELCRVLAAEKAIDTVLYLTPNAQILYVLASEFRNVSKRIGFGLSAAFQQDLLDTRVLTNLSKSDVVSFREFLLG
jgi:Replication-relaxation